MYPNLWSTPLHLFWGLVIMYFSYSERLWNQVSSSTQRSPLWLLAYINVKDSHTFARQNLWLCWHMRGWIGVYFEQLTWWYPRLQLLLCRWIGCSKGNNSQCPFRGEVRVTCPWQERNWPKEGEFIPVVQICWETCSGACWRHVCYYRELPRQLRSYCSWERTVCPQDHTLEYKVLESISWTEGWNPLNSDSHTDEGLGLGNDWGGCMRVERKVLSSFWYLADYLLVFVLPQLGWK